MDPTPTDNELFDLHTLADYGKRGVLLLLSDSTNSDRPGYTQSERAVRPRMEEMFSRVGQARDRLLFQLLDPPHSTGAGRGAGSIGRKVAIVGRSMIIGDARSRIRWDCWRFRTAS